MPHFALFTSLRPGSRMAPESVGDLNRRVAERIGRECCGVEWGGTYAVLGPHDCLHIFEAPDGDAASRVARIVRSFGHAAGTRAAAPVERAPSARRKRREAER